MSYIGVKPTIGNFQICDAISVVNGQAAYTMQVGSVNVIPQSANHMIVSLNGTIQKPNSSFTVSGSTITFASNLVTNDVIDFIQILGDVLDLGVPSDATVTAAKLGANSITAAKLNDDIISGSTELASEPADTDEFLVSDAGTLKRIDYSLIKATAPGLVKISTVTCSDTATVDFDNLSSDYNMYIIIGSEIRPATNDIDFQMNFGTDGSTYDKNKTSVYFLKYNNEGDSDLGFTTHAGASLGNSTSDQQLMRNVRNHSNYGKAGQMKAYISGLGQGGNYASYDIYSNYWHTTNYSYATHVSGMVQANADCVRFKTNSGNIAVGKFTLYGVNQ